MSERPMTNAEIAASLVRTIRNQNYLITAKAAAALCPAIEQALVEAERRGMQRAAELCRTAGHTGYAKQVLLSMADDIEALVAKEQANAK